MQKPAMRSTNGRVDPHLKERIDHIQKYTDKLRKRHGELPKDVWTALVNKKAELVKMV